MALQIHWFFDRTTIVLAIEHTGNCVLHRPFLAKQALHSVSQDINLIP